MNIYDYEVEMKKTEVDGENVIPLFTYLKSQEGFKGLGKGVKALAMSAMLKKMDKDYKNNPDIKWNFTKFAVDRDGNVVDRFESTMDMRELEKCVEALIWEIAEGIPISFSFKRFDYRRHHDSTIEFEW